MYPASITTEEMKNMQQEWFNDLGGIISVLILKYMVLAKLITGLALTKQNIFVQKCILISI